MLLVSKVMFASAGAHAHAGPQARAVLSAGDKLGRVLVSNRGLMFGGVAGSGWQLMCNEALGVTTSELPELVTLPDDRLLAATSHGLQVSKDGGCNWQGVEPFAKTAAPSLVQHPERPELLYATAYGKGVSGLYASQDAAAHWTRLLAVDDGDYLRYLRVAPGRPDQLYMRKLALDGMRFVYSVWSSSDAGENWASYPVDVNADETDFVLLGVSPKDSSLLVAKAEAANPGAIAERLLVSRDAGQSFELAWSARSITAAEWSRDGSSLWIASDEGLFRSNDAAHSFERVGPAELVSCLKQTDQGLLLCGYYGGGAAGKPGVGRTSDGGETTEPWMVMTDVTEPLACEPSAPTTSTCAPFWADWKREILDNVVNSMLPSAAGAAGALASASGVAGTAPPSAGTRAGADSSPASGPNAGCSVALSSVSCPPATPTLGMLLLAAVALRALRRRASLSRLAVKPLRE